MGLPARAPTGAQNASSARSSATTMSRPSLRRPSPDTFDVGYRPLFQRGKAQPKRRRLLFAALALATVGPSVHALEAPAPDPEVGVPTPIIDNRVIVELDVPAGPAGQLDAQAVQEAAEAAVGAAGDPQVIEVIEGSGLLVVEADSTQLEALQSSGHVKALHEDTLLRPATEVPDLVPLGDSTNTPAAPNTETAPSAAVGASAAHQAGLTGAGRIVAVLDSGVDVNHPYLAGRIAGQACFSSTSASMGATSLCPGGVDSHRSGGNACPVTVEGCDHGTHVAGIIAGKPTTVAGLALSGVAPDSQVLAVQVFSRFDNPDLCGSANPCAMAFTSDVIAALDWIASISPDRPVTAVNMSFGSGAHSSPCTSGAGAASVNRVRYGGASVVAAMGNSGNPNAGAWPACLPGVVSVAATGSVASPSDYRQVAPYSNAASWTVLAAPGTYVPGALPGGQWASLSGTSMATPHVSAALTLIDQLTPGQATHLRELDLIERASVIVDQRSGRQLRQISLTSLKPPAPPEPEPDNPTPATPTLDGPAPLIDIARDVTVTVKEPAAGATSFQIQRRLAGASGTFTDWANAATVTSPQWKTSTSPGATYCFRARANSAAGSQSGWSNERCRAVPLDDRNLTTRGSWARPYANGSYMSTVTRSTSRGSILEREGMTARRVFLVATRCPSCGTVRITLDGAAVRTVDLWAETTTPGALVSVATFPELRQGTLRLEVTTQGRLVEVDGFVLSPL